VAGRERPKPVDVVTITEAANILGVMRQARQPS